MKTSLPNDKRNLPYGGSFSIQDKEIIKFMSSINLIDSLWQENVNREFCEKYLSWIKSSQNNSVSGLEKFRYSMYSNGTSESFELFYIKNKNRRFRCFKGEYIYHQLAWRNDWPNWKFIENLDIEETDAVVISLPFSDSGNEHVEMKDLFEICEIKNVPVLLDCAYFGICSDVDFNFNYKCITDIAFSLSKTFPVAHARIGMRITKIDDDDIMFVYDKINYNNRLGARIGIELCNFFGPDFIYEKYNVKQRELCHQLDVIPSKSVIFGLDYNNKYPEYNRGTETNRLSLNKYLNA